MIISNFTQPYMTLSDMIPPYLPYKKNIKYDLNLSIYSLTVNQLDNAKVVSLLFRMDNYPLQVPQWMKPFNSLIGKFLIELFHFDFACVIAL